MKGALSIWVLFSAAVALAGQRMSVAVCNVGQIPGTVIEHAEAEAGYVFWTINVEIHWTSCGGRRQRCADPPGFHRSGASGRAYRQGRIRIARAYGPGVPRYRRRRLHGGYQSKAIFRGSDLRSLGYTLCPYKSSDGNSLKPAKRNIASSLHLRCRSTGKLIS